MILLHEAEQLPREPARKLWKRARKGTTFLQIAFSMVVGRGGGGAVIQNGGEERQHFQILHVLSLLPVITVSPS